MMGIDFSQAFIDAANRIKEDRSISYTSQIEGSIEVPVARLLQTLCNMCMH